MPDTPVAQSPEPDRPPPDSRSKPPLSTARRRRSRSGKIIVPLVMTIFGFVLFVLAVLIEPARASDLPVPPPWHLGLTTPVPVAFIGYSAIQITPDTANIGISVELPVGTPPPAGFAYLIVEPPIGISFRSCPSHSSCSVVANTLGQGQIAGTQLVFAPVKGRGETATIVFRVNASGSGVASNGITASVAIPDVIYHGPGTPPIFAVDYPIPSASGYYWNSFPAAEVNKSSVVWEEPLVNGDTPGRSAIGSNGAGQVQDTLKAFLAGALVGIGGGGLVAAIQEAIDRLIPRKDSEGG
jgi:hypothetical protein